MIVWGETCHIYGPRKTCRSLSVLFLNPKTVLSMTALNFWRNSMNAVHRVTGQVCANSCNGGFTGQLGGGVPLGNQNILKCPGMWVFLWKSYSWCELFVSKCLRPVILGPRQICLDIAIPASMTERSLMSQEQIQRRGDFYITGQLENIPRENLEESDLLDYFYPLDLSNLDSTVVSMKGKVVWN